jgi:hypothetical protein
MKSKLLTHVLREKTKKKKTVIFYIAITSSLEI